MKVTIEIDDAQSTIDKLADLTCWWDGFKIGLKASNNDPDIIADRGIIAIKDLMDKLKYAIHYEETKNHHN